MSSRTRRLKEVQASLFDSPPAHVPPRRVPPAAGSVRGMVRHPDRETSIAAAESAKAGRAKLKELIYQALKDRGPMNDGELAALFPFTPVSSVAKRRGDLSQEDPPRVVATDARTPHPQRPRSMMIVWRAV